MVKEFLSQRGIGFTEYDVSRDPAAAQELVRSTGQMGVPVTVINGQTIVGFDRNQLEQAVSQQQRPSLGASVADASKITARYGTGIILGAFVGRVRPNSLAERLGLSAGDVIIELNMQRIPTADDLEKVISRLSKGSRVSLVFVRGNKEITAEGTL